MRANLFYNNFITFKASGEISFGTFAGYGDADGIDGFTSYNLFVGFRHGSLLGRIGDNAPFLIGTGKEFIIQESGRIQLLVNDEDASNNRGKFIIQYKITNNNSSDQPGNKVQPASGTSGFFIDSKTLKYINKELFDRDPSNDKIVSPLQLLVKGKPTIFLFSTEETIIPQDQRDFIKDVTAYYSMQVEGSWFGLNIITAYKKDCIECMPLMGESGMFFHDYYLDEDFNYVKKMGITELPVLLFTDDKGKILKKMKFKEYGESYKEFQNILGELKKIYQVK